MPTTTMCSIKKLMVPLGFFILSNTSAQDKWTGIWQPDVSMNYAVSPNYSHNFALFCQNYTYRDKKVQLHVRHFDIAHFSTFRVRDDQSLAIGIMYRFPSGFEDTIENELRITQQYNLIHKKNGLRFGHRLRSEQRISPSLTVHRFRYRFALDFPLRGAALDIGEPYLVVATESLLNVAQGRKPRYDQWFAVRTGWWAAKAVKWEAGMEYRRQDYFKEKWNVLFLSTSLIFSL